MVGCVVLNFNDSKTTIELVNRMKNMKSIDVIVVVDNCSTDDSFSVLKQYTSKKIQVIQSEKNGGYGYGNNCGIAFLKKNFDCDYILIANPDVIFEENVIQKMKDAFDEETVIVAPLTLDAKGNRQLPIAWKVPTIKDYYLFSSILFNKIFHSLDYPKDFYNQSVCYVDCVQGSFFVIRSCLIENKLYDENIFLFFEESCIGKKFKDLGYKTKLLMDVDYIHNYSVSINKVFRSEAKKSKMTLDSFYTYFSDFYTLSRFQKKIMKAYKKMIYLENYVLLKIFFD